MGILDFSGFEQDYFNFLAPGRRLSATVKRSGKYAAYRGNAYNSREALAISGYKVAVYVRCYIRYESIVATYLNLMGTIIGTGPVYSNQVQLDNTGRLYWQSGYPAGAPRSAPSSCVLLPNTWYRLEFVQYSSYSDPHTIPFAIRVDGTTVCSGYSDSNGDLGTSPTTVTLYDNGGDAAGVVYYDDFMMRDDTWCGVGSCASLEAKADSIVYPASADGLQAYPSGDAWQAVQQDDHDLTYIRRIGAVSTNYSSTLQSADNITGTIVGVKVIGVAKLVNAGDTAQIFLRVGSTDYTVATVYGTLYGVYTKLYATNPATSAAWTQAALNSAEVGFNATGAARCTLLRLEVAFTGAPYSDGDTTPPTCAISAPSSAGPVKNGTSVTYTITYADDTAVTGITLSNGDITLNKTGTANATVAVSGTGLATRTVTLSNITGDGTLGISIAAGTASDAAANLAPAAGPSATFAVDNTAPTISVGDPSATLTGSGPITYTLTYGGAAAITLATGDVTLVKTGTADGTVGVSGTGLTTRTVTITDITGDGTLSITVAAGTASDAAGNLAAAISTSVAFLADNTPPVCLIGPPQITGGKLTADTGDHVTFQIAYTDLHSFSVTLLVANITITTTGTVSHGTAVVNGGTTSAPTVMIPDLDGIGTLRISIAAGCAVDTAGNTDIGAGPSAAAVIAAVIDGPVMLLGTELYNVEPAEGI